VSIRGPHLLSFIFKVSTEDHPWCGLLEYPETIDTGCLMNTQTQEDMKRAILAELPRLMESDPEIRDFILRITRERFADKEETESRFDRMMSELQRDREIQEKKWESWDKKWEEERKAQDKKWEAQDKKWEAWEKKWEENQQVQSSLRRAQNRTFFWTFFYIGDLPTSMRNNFPAGVRAFKELSFRQNCSWAARRDGCSNGSRRTVTCSDSL